MPTKSRHHISEVLTAYLDHLNKDQMARREDLQALRMEAPTDGRGDLVDQTADAAVLALEARGVAVTEEVSGYQREIREALSNGGGGFHVIEEEDGDGAQRVFLLVPGGQARQFQLPDQTWVTAIDPKAPKAVEFLNELST